MQELYRGDTWDFEFTIKDSHGGLIDLSTWKVRSSITGTSGSTVVNIKKANINVTGGSDTEISIVSTGVILVSYKPTDTLSLAVGSLLTVEVEIENTDGDKYTVGSAQITVLEDRITWSVK